ncbi:class I SAM-dependent methyltransferase [bacterium]|nr:class I SAM-dependent methyltransferase [bacterium]
MTSYFEARNVSPDFYKNHQLPLYLIDRLPNDKNAFILDFGCGFGQTMIALKQMGYKNIFGIDIDDCAISHCRNTGLNVSKVDKLEDVANQNAGNYDFIIMSHVLEHFPKDQVIPTLKLIRYMLKDGGKLMMMVPNAQSNTGCYWAYEDFTHYTLVYIR